MGRSNHGFTLLEMLVVVCIIAILVAVAAASLSSFREQRTIANDHMLLVSFLKRTRQDAIRKDMRIIIKVDGISNSLTAVEDSDDNNSFDQTDRFVSSITLSGDLKRVASGDAVTYTNYIGRYPGGDMTTIHTGLLGSDYTSANKQNWRSITFNTNTGLLETYGYGKNTPFP